MFLHIRMLHRAISDMLEKSGGFKKPAASFAPLQRVTTDQFVPDGNCSDILHIVHPDGLGGADIRAGSATDTATLHRRNVIFSIPFLHLQRGWPHDIITDLDAQPTTDTAIRRRSQINATAFGQISDQLRLRCHTQKVMKGPGSGLGNALSFGLNGQSFLHLEDTGKRGGLTTAFARDFNCTQLARP